MLWLYIFIFVLSCAILFWSGSWLVMALVRVARYLSWREFVVSFVIMAFASSLPNLFVGINSVIHGVPQLSVGDVLGGNIVDLTLAIGLAVLISKRDLLAPSRLIRSSAIFTTAIAILPLLLMLDGALTRGDGLILLGSFIFYLFWLFSKKERFKKIYTDDNGVPLIKEFKDFLKDIAKLIIASAFLLLAAEGMVRSSIYFVDLLKVSLPVIGILLVGLGNALPETYFAVAAARKEENWSVLGNLMGAVIVPSTLVLGIVVLLSPIKISQLSLFLLARIFLLISAVFFLFIVRTGQKITKKEACVLLSIYIIFVAAEIIVS